MKYTVNVIVHATNYWSGSVRAVTISEVLSIWKKLTFFRIINFEIENDWIVFVYDLQMIDDLKKWLKVKKNISFLFLIQPKMDDWIKKRKETVRDKSSINLPM